MTFHIGQKVVTLKSDLPDILPRMLPRLPPGTIVTIRDIDLRGLKHGHTAATLRFEEVIGPSVPSIEGQWEVGYDARCFRPITEKKTDISIFTAMLKTERQPQLTEQ